MRILNLTEREYSILVSILEDAAGEAQNALDTKAWEDPTQDDGSTKEGYEAVIQLQEKIAQGA